MDPSAPAEKPARSAARERALAFFRHTPGARLGLGAAAVAALAAGAVLNWGWLTAIGVAPLLIAFAPCALMCALGICMNRMGGRSCSPRDSVTKPDSSESISNSPRQ